MEVEILVCFVTRRKLERKRIVSNWWYIDEKKIVTGKGNAGATLTGEIKGTGRRKL